MTDARNKFDREMAVTEKSDGNVSFLVLRGEIEEGGEGEENGAKIVSHGRQ